MWSDPNRQENVCHFSLTRVAAKSSWMKLSGKCKHYINNRISVCLAMEDLLFVQRASQPSESLSPGLLTTFTSWLTVVAKPRTKSLFRRDSIAGKLFGNKMGTLWFYNIPYPGVWKSGLQGKPSPRALKLSSDPIFTVRSGPTSCPSSFILLEPQQHPTINCHNNPLGL